MWRQLGCVLVVLCLASTAQAELEPVVDVTTSINAPLVGGKYQVTLGDTYTLSVYGQLKSAWATEDNGIFSWDVDLRVGDTSILSLLMATVDRSGWTNYKTTSSSGTPTTWGLDAIYDTGESSTDLGLDSAVRLFSIDFTATKAGQSTLAIEPDYTTGSSGGDFITWNTDMGGDYSLATATVNVVPEPNSLILVIGRP